MVEETFPLVDSVQRASWGFAQVSLEQVLGL
jgi:hypothetical protein